MANVIGRLLNWLNHLPDLLSGASEWLREAAGVPVEHAADFQVALYGGLFSALFVALLAGLFVSWLAGVLVDRSARRADERRAARELEWQLAAFRERLRYALDQPAVLNLDSAVASEPAAAKAAARILADYPIHLWQHTATGDAKDFLGAVLELQAAHSEFVGAAGKFDLAMRMAIRERNAAKDIEAKTDPAFWSFAIGVVNFHQPDRVLPWIEFDHNEVMLAYTGLRQDNRVLETWPAYRKAAVRVDSAIERLRHAIDSSHQIPLQQADPNAALPVLAKGMQSGTIMLMNAEQVPTPPTDDSH